MAIKKYKRGENVQLSEHFHLREFECRCGKCDFTLVDMDHIEKLERLRQELGKPIYINSGYRCPEHNRNIGGSPRSQHMYGKATDIRVKGMKPSDVWVYVTTKLIFDGVGRYLSFCHIDSRGYISRFDMR